MGPDADRRRRYAIVLGLLTGLFALRVAGQALVAFLGVPFLPAMSEWYSGLLPYPLLLPLQVVILVVQVAVCRDVGRGGGALGPPRPGWARPLLVASLVYAAAMVVRYAVTMAGHPERRWLGTGTIPIAFHAVLAGFLFTLGRFHAAPRPGAR